MQGAEASLGLGSPNEGGQHIVPVTDLLPCSGQGNDSGGNGSEQGDGTWSSLGFRMP